MLDLPGWWWAGSDVANNAKAKRQTRAVRSDNRGKVLERTDHMQASGWLQSGAPKKKIQNLLVLPQRLLVRLWQYL